MKHLFGLESYPYTKENGRTVPLIINTDELVNAHMLIAGISGSGKSYQLMRLAETAARQGIELDIFDVHDDLVISKATDVVYSEATKYGCNPLRLHSDPHSGGVRKQINLFLSLLNSTSTQLGVKQTACLRYLLQDVYFLNGIYENKPATWVKQDITEAERTRLIEARDYNALKAYYPTISDLLEFAKRKLKTLFLGTDNKSLNALEQVNKQATRLNTLLNKQSKMTSDDEADKLAEQIKKTKEKAIELYRDYVTGIDTGREFNQVLKYSSKDVLLSVIERLETLNASGIFYATPPPFGSAKVRRHRLKALTRDEQKLFLSFWIEEVFRQRKDAGATNKLQHMLIVDEAHLFMTEGEENNVLDKVSREGRKFGLGLICASQSPLHFSLDFLTNCSVTILLGIHSQFWDAAVRKLNVNRESLEYVKARETALIRRQRVGQIDAQFTRAMIDDGILRSYAASKRQ